MAGANLEEIRHDHSVVAGAGRRFGDPRGIQCAPARLHTHLSLHVGVRDHEGHLFNGPLTIRFAGRPEFS